MDKERKTAKKKVAKAWTCPACGHRNDAKQCFFCEKCGFRNIETYG